MFSSLTRSCILRGWVHKQGRTERNNPRKVGSVVNCKNGFLKMAQKISKRNILVLAVVGIGGAVLIGVLVRTTMVSAFLGDATANIARCKKDPRFNPPLCKRLLANRTARRSTKSSFSRGDGNIAGGFQLGQ